MYENPIFWMLVAVIVLLIMNLIYLVMSDSVQAQNFTNAYQIMREHRAANCKEIYELKDKIDRIESSVDIIRRNSKTKRSYDDDYI